MGASSASSKAKVDAYATSATTTATSSSLDSKWISPGCDGVRSPSDGMGLSSASNPQSRGSRGDFHVFLSFRGPDVRDTLLVPLLLVFAHEGIRTFVDREDLRTGDNIMSSLNKAICNSRIAIIIFSVNYVYSRWCLDELVEIMDRWKRGELIVKPVFYRVEPREVRTPRYSFAKALASHDCGKDSNKLQRWREALSEAGNLYGWHLRENENEGELVRKIVEDINVVLDQTHLDVAKYPIGIEPRVARIKNLLNMEPDKVRFVGMWGMGGVGKTTLAKAVFNAVKDQFDVCTFLPNIREDSTNPSVGLAKLQEKLLSDVLRRKDVIVGSVARGIAQIRDRLCHKKVLLLLDDVKSREQLEALAGCLDWFGNGSRILVTTRDKSLLTAHGVHFIHEVECLPYNQALQLFRHHAFPGNDGPKSIAKDLEDRCLAYCDGLPLALVVLGYLLSTREEHQWESMMKLLEQQGLFKEIEEVLIVSFDGLDYNATEIFLSIAWFFKGETRREIEKAMDACGFITSLGIDMLNEKSLITIIKDTTCGFIGERVGMHPLLQLMGRTIVPRGSPESENRRHVRQWINKCTCGIILSDGTVNNTAKGSASRSPHPEEDILTNSKKSRLLVAGNDRDDGDSKCPLHELRWTERSGYSAQNTFFCQTRKFKVNNSICCERIACNCPRSAL